jgi:hypothetical protein
MSDTAENICTDALREIGVINAADPASGEDGTLALGRLNMLLDSMQAEPTDTFAQALSGLSLPVAMADSIVLPPGYRAYLMYTLAIDLATPFRVAVDRKTLDASAAARLRVYGKEQDRVKIRTRDDGMPRQRYWSTWNYRTGSWT